MMLQAKYPAGIWLIDFEFRPEGGVDGSNPEVVCLVAREYFSGQLLRFLQEDLARMKSAPYPTGDKAITVAYYASAEMGAFLALGWELPVNVLDLFIVFRGLLNGIKPKFGFRLLGALSHFGIPSITDNEKDQGRGLALRGGPYTADETAYLLDYCQSDVDVLKPLLEELLPHVDWPRIFLHGDYTKAAAHIERTGIPIDVEVLSTVKAKWLEIMSNLIGEIDQQYGVYEGTTFKVKKFEEYLLGAGIPWPRLPSGQLDLKDETFKEMARIYPVLSPLRELRVTLSQSRDIKLPVGMDGRNRTLLSYFQSITGRNQPSTSKFIFGNASWWRGLIKPAQGWGLAYVDYSQQEFGIAAALSGDQNMIAAYKSGDPYLSFAKQVGAVPQDATKKSHPNEREQFKQCILATQYGMGAAALAVRINQPEIYARELLKYHRQAYKVFWTWSDRVVDYAVITGRLWTVFNWGLKVGTDVNERSLRNFPMQANGAEMLRLACMMATEAGIRVCAPVHDALLVEAPLEVLDEVVAEIQQIMKEASAIILGGFELATDVKFVRYPNRYMDPRGVHMWNTIMKLAGLPDKVQTDA
jgi:DNA polymerase I